MFVNLPRQGRSEVIEDRGSTGGDTQKMQKSALAARGRKPKYESRAPEFLQELMSWKQMPEHLRPPLRVLARQLNTSHQILAYYLDGLEIRHAMESKRRDEEESKRRMDEIRARAAAEGRSMTAWEEQQVATYRERRWRSGLSAALLNQLWKLKKKAENGPLDPIEIKMLKIYAKNGYPGAQEMLQRCSQQKVEPKRTAEKDHLAVRLSKLITRFEERGGILLLDEGEIRYLVQDQDNESRALLAALYEQREEVKQFVGECVGRLTKGKYEKLKAEICQRIPVAQLSRLDEFKPQW